jgi:Domain of Unknown Function (DUF1259)
MPLYITVSPDKLARRRRFFESQFLVDCRVAKEENPVLKELLGHGIESTALHSHMLDEQPRLFFMHFWANDGGKSLQQVCAPPSTRSISRRASGRLGAALEGASAGKHAPLKGTGEE